MSKRECLGGVNHYFALRPDRLPSGLVQCQCGLARLNPETGEVTVTFPEEPAEEEETAP